MAAITNHDLGLWITTDETGKYYSMTIESISTVIIDLPLRRLQRFSALDSNSQSIVLIRITAKNGVQGIGESVTPSGPWWGGESVETIKTIIDLYLAPCLIGEDFINLANLMDRMNKAVHGNFFAKAGVEMALLDLIGKTLDQPIYNLLGGKFRDSLVVSWPLATGDANAEIEEAEKMLSSGVCKSFKMKMGALNPEQDIKRATKVAKALHGRARIRIDPNEMWDEGTARNLLPRLEAIGIEIIEQPMPRWNLNASTRLTHQARTTEIMIDEGVCTARDMLDVVHHHAAGLVSIKIMKMGGMRSARLIGDIAQAGGVSIYMGTFLESSLGTAANMQLAATFSHLPYGGELIGPLLIADDICIINATYKNGELQLNSGPGLGVELNEEKVVELQRKETLIVKSVA